MGASCWGLRTDGPVGPQTPVGDLIEGGTSGVGDEHLVRDATGVHAGAAPRRSLRRDGRLRPERGRGSNRCQLAENKGRMFPLEDWLPATGRAGASPPPTGR